MLAAPVSEIASPTLMSGLAAAVAAAVAVPVTVGPAVEPPQAETMSEAAAATMAARRSFMRFLPAREGARPMLANVERLAHRRLAAAGRRPARHDVHRAADREYAEAMARRGQIGSPRPPARHLVEDLHLAERAERLLTSDENESRSDDRGAHPAARGRRVGE